MKELGHGQYQPEVSAFFPKTMRGHGSMDKYEQDSIMTAQGEKRIRGKRRSRLCNAQSCDLNTGKGEKHFAQGENRKTWEESVGLRRTNKSTKVAAVGAAAFIASMVDPKSLLNSLAQAGTQD
jgi:hypothetical protein